MLGECERLGPLCGRGLPNQQPQCLAALQQARRCKASIRLPQMNARRLCLLDSSSLCHWLRPQLLLASPPRPAAGLDPSPSSGGQRASTLGMPCVHTLTPIRLCLPSPVLETSSVHALALTARGLLCRCCALQMLLLHTTPSCRLACTAKGRARSYHSPHLPPPCPSTHLHQLLISQ